MIKIMLLGRFGHELFRKRCYPTEFECVLEDPQVYRLSTSSYLWNRQVTGRPDLFTKRPKHFADTEDSEGLIAKERVT
ncbi:hypothetical protein T265_11788 [Opisthorchis viverrini]|uniref:Uncharacterized protein n=1 Tax=Opisthorchis viverrini TaxID=6198 RepID=A0A074Z1R8_OPIVI|nr:hypothetical protein T265_11788 [Opisthorchis viverrini]KER19437.1 hypothetical protein T265_11788 [Opisthorchis viverrini]